MIEFTFDSFFRTTNKGLPDTNSLQPYTYITTNHFVYSLIVEIILALVITIYTALSAYRVFYKIKNPKFNSMQAQQEDQQQQDETNQDEQEDEETDSKKQHTKVKKLNGLQAEETDDNLIYRFDPEEGSQKENNGEEEQQENQSEQEQEYAQQMSSQTTQWYLSIDHKMLFLQPFLISFVVVVNIFASNIVVVILLGLGLIMFYLFNIKCWGNNYKILKILFTLPCITVFVMVYFQDLDMRT